MLKELTVGQSDRHSDRQTDRQTVARLIFRRGSSRIQQAYYVIAELIAVSSASTELCPGTKTC